MRPSVFASPVLLLVTLGSAAALPTKQSNAGDSISQGFDANDLPSDQTQVSWIQGTSSRVYSVFERYAESTSDYWQEPESVTGAELVGGDDNFAAQAWRICQQEQKPGYVAVLLGGNDVCNRPASDSWDATANLYSVPTWTEALRAGLDQLADCLPAGAQVQVVSMPRVDFLYDAGHAKSFWCSWGIWPIAGICRIVTGESDAGRRAQIGDMVNQYNAASHAEVLAYDSNSNGKNPRGIRFTNDWAGSLEDGHWNSSVGSVVFNADDINVVDCFHPNIQGQNKIACAAWASNADGAGQVEECVQ